MIERQDFSEAAIARRLYRLLLAILVGSFVVGLVLSYWSVVRSDVLAGRPDNPRAVEAELRVQRGSIVDRNNVVLAENIGPLDQQSRDYPVEEAGPAVGHYSLRFGVAGAEAAYDSVLRGADVSSTESELNSLMHLSPTGRDVRLALNATLQQTGTRLMEGQQGALVLLELTGTTEQPTAEVRAMVSQPWYDPNNLDALLEDLDEGEDASFFNRVTQGQYQPGLLLLPLLGAAAIDSGAIDPAAALPETDVSTDGQDAGGLCPETSTESGVTWLEAIRSLCPQAAAELGQLMGSADLSFVFSALGLMSAPDIPIRTAEVVEVPISDPERAALGQETLTVSPLQLALAYGALAGNGRVPAPRLVDAVESITGRWIDVELMAPESIVGAAFESVSAALVRRALPRTDDISETIVSVLSSPDGQTNQWYVGITPSDEPRYIVVVVLEQPDDADAAAIIGRDLLNQAMLQP